MGLSASQARLLSITSRINDVEFKAQQIMNEKVDLATQKDAVYDEYENAMEAKKLQIAYNGSNGALNYVDATFATVCGYNNERNGTYALIDESTGLMVVEDDVYQAYNNGYDGGDKYSFAWRMLGFEENDFAWADNGRDGTGNMVGVDSQSGNAVTVGEGEEQFNVLAMTDVEQYVFDKLEKANNLDSDVSAKYQKYQEALETKDKSKISDALNKFREAFVNKYKKEIYEAMRLDKDDDISKEQSTSNGSTIPGFGEYESEISEEFNYYVRLFEGIENCGGCIPISKYSQDGDTGNDWFGNLINSGKVSLNEYNERKKDWNSISPSTSTNMRAVADETAIKKAEVKYKRKLEELESKEKDLDRNLTNLETERNALTTERDSIKSVIKDNIDRTFKIFS